MRPTQTLRGSLLVGVVALLVACSDAGTAEPTAPSLDPITTPATTTTVVVTTTSAPAITLATTTDAETVPTDAPTTTRAEPATTVGETTTVATTEPETTAVPTLTGPMFSDDLGTKVDTAPGVNTPGDTRELMPGLWVHIAWAPDPNDPSVFTVQEGDQEILEAYANAVRVYYEASTTTVAVDPAKFAPYYEDKGEKYAAGFGERRAAGEVEDISNGILLRPYLLGEGRTEMSAVVYDCLLDGGTWRARDAATDTALPAPNGLVATMVLLDGVWKVDLLASEEDACL